MFQIEALGLCGGKEQLDFPPKSIPFHYLQGTFDRMDRVGREQPPVDQFLSRGQVGRDLPDLDDGYTDRTWQPFAFVRAPIKLAGPAEWYLLGKADLDQGRPFFSFVGCWQFQPTGRTGGQLAEQGADAVGKVDAEASAGVAAVEVDHGKDGGARRWIVTDPGVDPVSAGGFARGAAKVRVGDVGWIERVEVSGAESRVIQRKEKPLVILA